MPPVLTDPQASEIHFVLPQKVGIFSSHQMKTGSLPSKDCEWTYCSLTKGLNTASKEWRRAATSVIFTADFMLTGSQLAEGGGPVFPRLYDLASATTSSYEHTGEGNVNLSIPRCLETQMRSPDNPEFLKWPWYCTLPEEWAVCILNKDMRAKWLSWSFLKRYSYKSSLTCLSKSLVRKWKEIMLKQYLGKKGMVGTDKIVILPFFIKGWNHSILLWWNMPVSK